MHIVLAFFLLQILFTFLVKDYIPDLRVYGILMVLSSIVAISIFLFRTVERKWLWLIYTGFAIRVLTLFVDLYVPSISIFSSGSDSEYFHTASVSIAEGLLPVSAGRTYYVPFLSGIYYMIGDQRLYAQFLNIAFWVFSAVYLLKSFRYLKVGNQVTFISLGIFALMPNSIFMSSILLRESIIVFLISMSLHYFLLWFYERNILHFILAAIPALGSMIFHAGMVGFIIAYVLAFIFMTQEGRASGKKKSSKVLYLLFIGLLLVVLSMNNELFLGKFQDFGEDGVDSIKLAGNGGSAYLTNLEGISGLAIYAVAPIKMIYFMFSPLPTDWRGFGDIISFLMDSSIYFFLIVAIAIGLIKSDMSIRNKIMIATFIFITVFIYSYGTGNAGTAIRHRNKLLPMLLILFTIVQSRSAVKLPEAITKHIKGAKNERLANYRVAEVATLRETRDIK
ncbi:hypothetical protein [Planococcus sp. YIM B11945]|uniref:hypothetical protein n=1 Tax=Planococcus sp. YIM B11945 TaxID=3435410 RepID=UPI003D7C86D3